MCFGGWASFLGSGRSELHGHLLGVREVLCYLATLCIFQVHLPVHLPCYDLPPLYPVGIICLLGAGSGRVTGGVCALKGQFQQGTLFLAYC